ncbi:MAG: RluA family pseudouridine synthase [Myxococcota bacterium]
MDIEPFSVVKAGRLDAVVAGHLTTLSRSRAVGLIKSGDVQVDGTVVRKPSTAVMLGAIVRVQVPEPRPLGTPAQDLPLDIVYQDTDLVIVNKAAGMVVHPGPGHREGTLVNALLHHVQDLAGIGGVERPGIVHRLDRGTSGLMVVAKSDAAHKALSAQFAAHTAGRTYVAIVYGVPTATAGTSRSRLARHVRDRFRYASTEEEGAGKEAITHWRRLGAADGVAVVQCTLETGRTHQVRVHLTESGHPLLGDEVYRAGRTRLASDAREQVRALAVRPMLHARALSLDHPTTGERMTWTVEPPPDFALLAEALGLSEFL